MEDGRGFVVLQHKRIEKVEKSQRHAFGVNRTYVVVISKVSYALTTFPLEKSHV